MNVSLSLVLGDYLPDNATSVARNESVSKQDEDNNINTNTRFVSNE